MVLYLNIEGVEGEYTHAHIQITNEQKFKNIHIIKSLILRSSLKNI